MTLKAIDYQIVILQNCSENNHYSSNLNLSRKATNN